MTYKEFRDTYRWMLKQYPETSGLFSDDMTAVIGYVIRTDYTKRGSKWIQVSEEREPVTATNYMNCVDAIPFFRNLGGYERAEMGYTYYGYIPTRITSISPDRKERKVRRFRLGPNYTEDAR